MLQYGANDETSDQRMRTPSHHATHGSHSGLVAKLIEHGADLDSETPLELTACRDAASPDDFETIMLLLRARYGRRLATRDYSTPLHDAAEEKQLDTWRPLLQRKSGVLAKNRDDQTIFGLTESKTLLVPWNIRLVPQTYTPGASP